MEPGYPPQPIIINQRPYRNRPRLATEHYRRQPVYYDDGNGLLVAPGAGAGVYRSNSQASPKTAPIVITNQFKEPSPDRRERRRSYQERYDYSSTDSFEDRAHSHERRRPRSRSRGRRHRHKSRTPSPVHDPELEHRLRRLDELEQKEHEEAARQKFEQERIIEEAKKAKKAKELEELKKLAIEEHNAKVYEEELKKKKQKEEEDKAFQERLRETLFKAGYSEESIEKTLKGKGEKGDRGKKIMDLTRPTYIKVHRKHLSPDTLDVYRLPWEWDDKDSNYIVIKQWIPEHDQDLLFEHTRKLREGRLLTNASVEIKKERDKLLLVRKRSPSRRRSQSRGLIFSS